MTDPLAAVIAYLGADTAVRGLVLDRVFGLELPRDETDDMPEKTIVVKPSGSGTGVERGSKVDLTTTRFDVWNYGDTPYEARQLQLATYAALKALERKVVAGVLLHSAERVGGPIPIRDPLTDWPISIESFDVLASDLSIV